MRVKIDDPRAQVEYVQFSMLLIGITETAPATQQVSVHIATISVFFALCWIG